MGIVVVFGEGGGGDLQGFLCVKAVSVENMIFFVQDDDGVDIKIISQNVFGNGFRGGFFRNVHPFECSVVEEIDRIVFLGRPASIFRMCCRRKNVFKKKRCCRSVR